jgi:hypothetical protein
LETNIKFVVHEEFEGGMMARTKKSLAIWVGEKIVKKVCRGRPALLLPFEALHRL